MDRATQDQDRQLYDLGVMRCRDEKGSETFDLGVCGKRFGIWYQHMLDGMIACAAFMMNAGEENDSESAKAKSRCKLLGATYAMGAHQPVLNEWTAIVPEAGKFPIPVERLKKEFGAGWGIVQPCKCQKQ